MSLSSSVRLANGFIDDVSVVAGHLLRVTGWSLDDECDSLSLSVGGRNIPMSTFFRTYRPDVSEAIGNSNSFLGFVAEYILPAGSDLRIDLTYRGRPINSITASAAPPISHPDLLTTDLVQCREEVYCAGAPVEIFTPEILVLARLLPEPILDFGCGGCGTLRALLESGLDVYGVEVAGSLAASAIPDDLRGRVTIYDGKFPMPFRDGSFRSVVATEVIEHIRDYRGAIADIARVTSERALFTVPDNSVIPICADKALIPWHYLVPDHCNFFTQQSLTSCLKPHFNSVKISRSQRFEVGGVTAYSNLEALCYKSSPPEALGRQYHFNHGEDEERTDQPPENTRHSLFGWLQRLVSG